MVEGPFRDVDRVARVMRGFPRPWFVAGGWAIDLHLARRTRPHADVDVGLLRSDQGALRHHLRGWTLLKVDPPGGQGNLVPWREGEWLALPVHEVHARREGAAPASVEFLLNEAEDDRWRYRRQPAITRPLEKAILRSRFGIPYLAPEVVLLYKAKKHASRDHADLEAVLPSLGAEPRRWLAEALASHPPGHPWRGRLANP